MSLKIVNGVRDLIATPRKRGNQPSSSRSLSLGNLSALSKIPFPLTNSVPVQTTTSVITLPFRGSLR